MAELVLKKAQFTREDLRQVVGIHRREIDQGFLSSLGDAALNIVYSLLAESSSGVLIVATDASSGRIGGFICGTTQINTLYRDFLMKKTLSALIYLVPKLLTPSRIVKAFETLTYPARKQSTSIELPKSELLVFAVEEAYRGTGLSQQLFQSFVDEMRAKGVQQFKIGTGASLIRAHRFYEKMGARQVATIEVHRGQASYVYLYDIPHVQ